MTIRRTAGPPRRSSMQRLRSAPVPVEHASTKSAPVSMQPSGPVPNPIRASWRRRARARAPHDRAAGEFRRGAARVGAGDRLPRDAAQDLAARLLRVRARAQVDGERARARVRRRPRQQVGRRERARSRTSTSSRPCSSSSATRSRSRYACSTRRRSRRCRRASRSSSRRARTSHAERTKRETEAREHPITKHVLQTFGAQIKEIKTDV